MSLSIETESLNAPILKEITTRYLQLHKTECSEKEFPRFLVYIISISKLAMQDKSLLI